MRRLEIVLLELMLFWGCGTQLHVPSQTTTQVQTVIRDSVVIHRDTVTLTIPVESSSSFNVQSSHLETTVAWSDARIDSTGLLTHSLTNKPFQAQKEIIYQDRKVIEYRDSIQVREVPVEVEVIRKVVPKWCWYLLAVNVLLLIALGIKIYFKLKL